MIVRLVLCICISLAFSCVESLPYPNVLLLERAPLPASTPPTLRISQQDSVGSAAVLATGALASVANILAALYVFCRAYHQRSCLTKTGERLGIFVRFPLYMASLEFVTATLTLVNCLHGLAVDMLPGASVCSAMGATINFAVMTNMGLAGMMALIIYQKICRGCQVKIGRYDWRFLAYASLIPIAVTTATLCLKGFGNDTYWCFVLNQAVGQTLFFAILVTFNYIVLLATTYCYLQVIKKLVSADDELIVIVGINTFNETSEVVRKKRGSPPTAPVKPPHPLLRREGPITTPTSLALRAERLEWAGSPTHPIEASRLHNLSPATSIAPLVHPSTPRDCLPLSSKPQPLVSEANGGSVQQVTRKMTLFIIVHLLQYTGIIIYGLCRLFGYQAAWIYAVTLGCLHVGGVCKAYAYTQANHAWKTDKQTPADAKAQQSKGASPPIPPRLPAMLREMGEVQCVIEEGNSFTFALVPVQTVASPEVEPAAASARAGGGELLESASKLSPSPSSPSPISSPNPVPVPNIAAPFDPPHPLIIEPSPSLSPPLLFPDAGLQSSSSGRPSAAAAPI
ncbi:uncharacterized protein VTP21DRAFT_757 [Calcarisporiella thermophila]|uniref:uncharacterized protein n=1 Tax=Calcarisporiella thermophila TaxID=911321 RepID=UPI0037445BDA